MEHQINLDLNQTSGVTCEECGNPFFNQAMVIRKASGFLTGTGKPTLIPIPVFTCTKCDHVNKEFLPQEIKDLN